MSLDLSAFVSALLAGLSYVPVTLGLAIGAMIVGTASGTIIAAIRFFSVPLLAPLFAGFVAIARATPLVTLLFLTYFLFLGLFDTIAVGLSLDLSAKDVPLSLIAVAALALMVSALASEALRAGMLSVAAGQLDAARAVGMSGWQGFRRIVIPQMVPVCAPQLCNIFIGTTKATSLAHLISVSEVTGGAFTQASLSLRFAEAYLAIALIYWAISSASNRIFGWLEAQALRQGADPALLQKGA